MGIKKILVVDDDRDIREVIHYILDMDGFEVHELDNGHSVSEEIARFQPDVVLLDVMLGDMDGCAICKDLKSDAATRDIPVIIVSASHTAQTVSDKTCGADDYLAKPFDMDELLHRVRLQLAA